MRYKSKPAKNSGVRSGHWSVAMKTTAVLAAFVAVGVGGGSIVAALTKTAERNAVDLSYGSVSTAVEEGEVFVDDGTYDAVDIFARLNWRFARQKEWYGEYSGYVNTVVTQDVHTYKYYKDGMLISADITKSSLVNAAREFCYIKEGDRVLWREAAGGSSTYDKLDTPWQEGEPYRNMTISGENGFKALNGLPAYELSPYVIEPDTVLSSTVEEAEDGLYKATFVMNPATWKDVDENGNEIVKGANAYYINQMIFTGGLPEAPEFSALTITYYFDEDWITYKTVVEENYSAAYGPIKAPCKGGGTTTYSYEPYNSTDNVYPDAYDEYFQYWIDEEPDTDFDRPITALDALAGAFGPLLAEPSTLALDLDINGQKAAGTVFVDLSKTDLSAFDVTAIEARLGLGALNLWVEGGKAYINYGGVKLSLDLSALMGLFGSASPQAEGEESGGLNTDDLLGALANGAFTAEDGKAELHSVLPLLGYEIPIDFYFNVDEEKNVTLDRAAVAVDADLLSLGAEISFGGEAIPALGEVEKADYAELMPHIQSLIDLFTSENLHAALDYEGHGIKVGGGIDIALSPFSLKGEIALSVPEYGAEKKIALAYDDGEVYLDLGGIKVAANAADAVALVGKFLDLGSLAEGGLPFDLGEIVQTLLSPEFAQNIVSSEEESKLHLLLRGTKILEALGIDFALGDVSLQMGEETLTAGVLGLTATLTKGDGFTFTPEGYTELIPYVARIVELAKGGNLTAEVTYTGDTLSVSGELGLDLKALAAKADLALTYKGATKTLSVVYADGALYLTVDGLRIKADVKEAIELVKEYLDVSSGDGDALKIVADILSLDFSTLIELSQTGDDLTVAVAGTELLRALGHSFDLGRVELTVGKEEIVLTAAGAVVTVKAGAPFTYTTEGFSEIVKYAGTLLGIYKSGYLDLDLNYAIGELAITGEVHLDLTTFNVSASVTLASGRASKTAEILYMGGEIFLGLGEIRLKVNAKEAAALLGGLIDLGASGEEMDAVEALLSADFSTLIPELWESDGALHITVASGNLLSLFGLDLDLGDLRLAVDGEGATLKLGRAVVTAKAGAPFTPVAEGYLDITDYLGAVAGFAEAKALTLDVAYSGEKISLEGDIDILLDGTAAQGDLTLTYTDEEEGAQTEHAVYLLWTKGDGTLYLSIDGVKVKANVSDAISLIKTVVGSKSSEGQAEGAGISTLALTDEELTALEKLLSFDLGAFIDLAEHRTEEGGTLTLTVRGTELLSALGASFDLGDVALSLDTEGHIALSAIGGKLTIGVRAGESFEQGDVGDYIDIVKYGEYLAGLFSKRTYKISASYEVDALKVRADVSFDTVGKIVVGDLILIYKGAAKEASFTYEDGWFYLDLDAYKIKTKTAGAVALIAGYLGLSGTDGVKFESLASALDTSLDGLLTLRETAEGEQQILTVLIDGTALMKALGLSVDLGNVDIRVAEDYLYASLKGFGCEVTGSGAALEGLKEEDKAGFTDLSDYLDGFVNVFKQDYITVAVRYDEKGVKVVGDLYIDVKNKQARADLTLTLNGMEYVFGVVYEKGGMLYVDLDGAKIKADTQEILDLIKGLFTKKGESARNRKLRASADAPAQIALSEEQKSKLLGILETVLSLDLDNYFILSESGDDTLTLTVRGTELLSKLLKKDIALGDVEVKVEKTGGISLSVLGATLTATGSAEGFDLFKDGDKAQNYADILDYVGYLTDLFKAEALTLTIDSLEVTAGTTSINVEGTVDIKTDGTLAGGTLTLTVGGKSLTATLYYEKADGENILYIGVAGIKVKASIEDIKALVDKIKNKEPAAAAFFTVAATVAEGRLFGIFEEDGVLQLAVAGGKLGKLFGSDLGLDEIGLEIAEGRLGLCLSGEKFSLDATLKGADSVAFDPLENKDGYIDIVKYVDFAVDLFRADAFELGLGFTKGAFTLTGSASFAPQSKVASGQFTITYQTTSKHASFAYVDGTAYVALDGSNGPLKFKAKSAAAVGLLAAYFGFSGADGETDNTFEDLFQDLFGNFDSLFELAENAEKDVLTLLVDGTQLLEKLKISLGNFELGDIGVMLGKNSLTLHVLNAQLTLGGTDAAPVLPSAEELATYTDLSDYVDTFADLAASDCLEIALSYRSDDGTLTLTGTLSIDVRNKFARADLTVAKGETTIDLGIVYTEGGMLYIDLDGAKIKANVRDAVDYVKELVGGNAKGRARTVRNAPKAILSDEQKSKLSDLLTKLFTLELDDFFTLSEEKGALSLLIDGTGLLNKLLNKNIELGSVTLSVAKSVYGEDGALTACGSVTLKALGAEIVLRRGAAFVAFPDGDKEEDYTDILQYVKWAAAIFAQNEKHIDLTLAAGELSVGLGLDVIKGNAFVKGVITLSYRGSSKDFAFVYDKQGGESGDEGWIYLDLDGVQIKANTDDIMQLLKSLFSNLAGKEAEGPEKIALGYAAAAILEVDAISFESFDTFSLTEEEGVLTLAVSGEKLMSLLGEKLRSLLDGKFSLASVGVSVSETLFSVEADATLSGDSVTLSVGISKGETFEIGEEERKSLTSYIDVFKYGAMVKRLFTQSTTLQAEISATLGGKELGLTLKFNKDFTMAQGTLQYGSIDLDLMYVLEDREGAEGEKDVLIYVKVGDKVKLMANISEVIRLVKDAKEKKGRAMPAAIALTPKQETMLEKFLALDLGEVIKLTEKLAAAGEGDSLAVTVNSRKLLDVFGASFDLGTIEVTIEEGELIIALPDKANLSVTIYGTTRAVALEKPAEGDYHDITPIVKRVFDLIEAQGIEFSGELALGETKLTVEQGIVTWKTGEDKKFYLKGSLGDFVLELSIVGENAQLKLGNFGIEFAFSDIGDLINAVKGLIARVKGTLSTVKANVTGTAKREELIGTLQGIVDVLNNFIDFLKGGEAAASAAASAKAAYEMGGMAVVPAAYKPEGEAKELLLSFVLGKITLEIFDETGYENRGFLGLGLTLASDAFSVSAVVDTAVFTGEIPELTGEFYKLHDFIEILGYAGDAVALVAEPKLTAKVGGNVLSTNLSMYPDDGLVYDISGEMEYFSGDLDDKFPIRLDMDENVIEVNTDLFVHFKLLIAAGTQKTEVNGETVDTTPKNIYLDIFITDCDLNGDSNGELDFFVTISQVGEGKTGYDPLKLYAPAKEILTILSGAASILGMDSVTYVNEYLIKPLLDPDMVARLKGLGVSLIPTILDMLLKDDGAADGVAAIANGVEIPADAFGFGFGNVQLRFKSEGEGDSTYLASLGVTTSKEEAAGEKTYTKTTDLAFSFSRTVTEDRKPADLTGFFDIEGVDELILALGRTATHMATPDEVIAGIAEEGEYVRNDVFFIDGKLHLDLSIIGINLETIEINVDGLTVNFDANNKISLNAKLSYQGVHNALAGLVGSSDIILGDTTLDLTIKGDMMYLRRTQKTHFDGSTEKDLTVPEVIYRAFPLKNFMKDTQTMMNHLCFMFNLSEALVTRIMGMVGTGGSTPAAQPTDLGGFLDRYITGCTYEPHAPKDGLSNLIYTLVLNGAGLTNSDTFDDITVKLGVERGVLRSIDIPQFSIASVVHINANLRLRNPEYVWDDGSYDTTESIADVLEQAMANKLKSVDWLETAYLEGQLANVTYMLGDQEIGHQQIVFDPTTKELYANFSYPSIKNFLDKNPEYAQDGYTYEWERYDPANFKSEMTLYAKPKANVYDLIFIIEQADVEKYRVTEEELEEAGYSWNDEYNAYVHIYHWTYNPENYIALPYVTTVAGRTIGFLCPNGNLHNEDHRGLDFYDQPIVKYKAVWDYIDYTVTFELGNGQPSIKQTGHYGDTVNYPDNPAREGYDFNGWDKTIGTIVGNDTVKATWTPCTYEVKLVSEYPITWPGLEFVEENGKYVATITFTYDSDVELPKNIEYDSESAGTVILKGFSKDGVLYSEYLPNVTGAATFTAVWDERGFKIEFTDGDGNVYATRYKRAGESFTQSELPDLGKLRRNGYTAEWNIDINSFKASDDCTVSVKYTGITYYIHEYSLKRVDGFTEVKGEFDSEGIQGTSYWKKTYAYVYGGTPHPLTLGVSEDVRGFDFDGYYTERFGQGTKIDPAVINDEMIEKIFKFRVGNSEDFYEQNVLFANWIDNSVEVHLYSDFDFVGSMGHDIDGYYKSVKKMEGDYDISGETLNLSGNTGLRRLGWWYFDETTANWSAIDNVETFRNTDLRTQATVKIFAMWIEDIDIKITSFDTNSMLGGAQYNIGGTLTGGIPSGVNSISIYNAVKMAPTTTGYYVLFNKDGSTSDTPGGKRDITVTRDPVSNVGSFQQTGMNSGTFGAFVWTERASYGGVIMRMEFTYGSDSIVFYGGNVVSMETYTVTYHKEGGDVVGQVEGVRTGYNGKYNLSDFSGWGVTAADLMFDNTVYADELAAENGIACPQDGSRADEGNYEWPHRAITGNADIYPSFVLAPVTVVFTSNFKFSNAWRASADGKTFTYTTKMRPYSTIEFIANGIVFETYTVEEGKQSQTFAVPTDLPLAADVRKGYWTEGSAVIGEYGATFTVQYSPDTIIYYSELGFNVTAKDYTYGFDAKTEYSFEYSSEHTLIVPDNNATTVDGVTYRFLGWYAKNTDGTWRKLGATLKITASEEPTYAHALWMSELVVTVTKATAKYNLRVKYDYTIAASIRGGKLVGAFANEGVSVKTIYRFYANNNTDHEAGTSNGGHTYNDYRTSDSVDFSISNIAGQNKKQGHAVVTVEYTYQGITVSTGEVHAVKAITT